MRRAGGNVMDDKRRAKVLPVPGIEDPDVELVADADTDEVEEDVLEDTSDLEDDAIAEVEVEVESPDEER